MNTMYQVGVKWSPGKRFMIIGYMALEIDLVNYSSENSGQLYLTVDIFYVLNIELS